MKREKLNTLSERDILIGLIVSDKFCREVAPVLNPRLLEVEYARIVAGWIIDFYKKFKKSPHKDIIKLYRSHCEELRDEALQDNVLSFIEKVSKDYDTLSSFNDEFALQQSIQYLKGRALRNLNEDIDAYLISGEVNKAENAITKFRRVEKNSGESISLFVDSDEIANTFLNNDTTLFQFPGAYGKVIGKLHREDFFAYLAPMKRGKSFHLMYTAETACQAGLKVVFFSLEMSRAEMIRRFWTSLSGQLSEDVEDIDYPYFVEGDSGKFEVEHKTISRKAVDITEIRKKQKSMKRLFRGGDIRIVSVPAYSLTVENLEIMLEDMEQNDYIPDVIIVDYADIMAPSEKGEYRNQLDGIWKGLRGLAQKRKALVVTASQSGRSSIDKNVEATDIAEDIRKLAHVTSMVSLNQTPSDVKNGIMKVKQLAIREGAREFRQAVVTQCLTIGRPVMESYFDDEVYLEYEQENDKKKSGRSKK